MARLIHELGVPEAVRDGYTAIRDSSHGIQWDNKRISDLGSLNVLIGPNNSGKSRLLRSIMRDHNGAFLPAFQPWGPIIQGYKSLRELIPPPSQGASRYTELVWSEHPLVGSRLKWFEEYQSIHEKWHHIRGHMDLPAGYPRDKYPAVETHRRDILNNLQDLTENHKPKTPDFHRVYIPTLRSLRPLDTRDMLADRTIRDYFGNNRKGITVDAHDQPFGSPVEAKLFTGQNFYEVVRQHLLGQLADRQKIASFEHFLSMSFYQGKSVTLIPREENNGSNETLHIKIGHARERPAYELGDGISQIICLTLPMFLLDDRQTLFFIEEPELNLHQGLQRLLVDIILNGPGSNNRQVFISTHSQQFLDLTLDVNDITIYRLGSSLDPLQQGELEKDPTFTVELVSGDRRPLLRELGVHNSSVLLANCTIWVEGITDRLYLRHFIRLYQKQLPPDAHRFLEDIHYAFIEYGGSSIQHWSIANEDREAINVDYLCSQGLLIVDRDEKRWKDKQHTELEAKLGSHFLRLPVREVENLLTSEVVRDVVREYENDPSLDILPNKSKKFESKLLGKYIQEVFFDDRRTSQRRSKDANPYADKSGTIKDKLGFCQKAIRYTDSYGKLSSQARAVCEQIYRFIKSNQPQ